MEGQVAVMNAALRESAKPRVSVLGTGGKVATRFQTQGLLPTNVAFALRGVPRIHVAEYEFGQVEVFETPLAFWAGLKASVVA